MNNVRITGMSKTAGKPNQGGTRIVGFFDCELPHLSLRGCALARKPDGTWVAWTPKLPDDDGTAKRAVYFRGGALQRHLTEQALALYRQLGGRIGIESDSLAV
jgi:hypothetical protein